MSYSTRSSKSTRSTARKRARILAGSLACGTIIGINTSPLINQTAEATGIEMSEGWEDHDATPISMHSALRNIRSFQSSKLNTFSKAFASWTENATTAGPSEEAAASANDAAATPSTAAAQNLQAILVAGIIQNFTTSAGTFYVPLEGRGAPSGMSLIGVRGTFITESAGQNLDTAIAHINEIRKDAYNSGLVDRYVPIKRSAALERTAQIRAVEATVYPGHTRPNGQSFSSISNEGFASGTGECIAWGGHTLHAAIDQWAAEKQDYINARNGRNTGITGHYEALINPNNTYVGLGMFMHSSTYGTTIVGRFAGNDPAGPSGNLSGEVIQGIYVPNSAVVSSPEFTLQSSSIGSQAVFSATNKAINARSLIESEINR